MQVIHQYFALIILIRVILIGRVRLSDSEMVLFHPSSASRFTSKDWKRAGLRLAPEELKKACPWPLRIPRKWQPQAHNLSLMMIMAMPCLLLLIALKTRLNEALARVERLEREKKNSMAREKRAKTTVKSLLGDLREKNLINEELKEKLEFYSDRPHGKARP
ncbi:hypothetical protein cypCar_00023037 [Cyprinus carpio]|nr:hypothetical protein cypCar_00023037 [Cyprinus carpio]